MKIYDKEALLMVVFDFLMIAMALWNFYSRVPAVHNIAILLYGCSRFKNNIMSAFSEENSKKRRKQVEKEKQAYKNVFGRFALFAPFSFFILLAIGLLLLKILKGSMLGIYVIIFGLFSPMLVDAIITTEMHRMETEQE